VFFHFSVVTVVRNDLDGLIKTRDSLEKQEYTNWLHVIVDGNSTDGTKNYLRSLPEINTLYVSEHDSGIYSAMNKGWKMAASGSFVFYLNARDVFASNQSLKFCAEAMISNSEKSWGCTTHEEVNEDGTGWVSKLVSPPSIPNQLYAFGYRSHQAVVMRKEFINSLGGFDETFLIAADWDLIVKAMLKENPLIWTFPLARFEVGGFSTKKILEAHEELYKLRKIYLLRDSSSYAFDYLWRSLYLFEIGHRTLVGKLLRPIFEFQRKNRRDSFLRKLYRKVFIKEHGKFVRRAPTRLRRNLLRMMGFLVIRNLRHNLFYSMGKKIRQRLKLNEFQAPQN